MSCVVQTLRGRPALGPTSIEYLDVMRKIQRRAEATNAAYGLGEPLYSFDNAAIHNMEMLEQIGITAGENGNRVPLPARSPDMHKVIEHVFAILEGGMQALLHEDPSLTKGKEYAAALRQLFKSMITQQSIEKDIRSLMPLYGMLHRSRSRGGVEGDWPPAKFR